MSASSFQYPPSGPSNVLEYMASGLPYVIASTGNSKIEFPFVTNFIKIQNVGGSEVHVGFTENGLNSINYFTVASGEAVELPFRVMDLFVSASDDWELLAGLTQIPRKNFFILTGSFNGFSGSQENYGFRGFGYPDGLG